MNLALLEVDRDDTQTFFDVNALAHETIFGELLRGGIVLDHYPLWTSEATPDWLDIHYREHLAWSVELALPLPPDLTAVDFDDDQAREQWRYVHALHHQLVAQDLGV